MCDSISESLATLNHEKLTVSRPSVVSDLPVSNGRSLPVQSTPTHRTDTSRVVGRESTLRPLNTTTSSSNLDSSVQTIIEKMHSGLEVCCCLLIWPHFCLVVFALFVILILFWFCDWWYIWLQKKENWPEYRHIVQATTLKQLTTTFFATSVHRSKLSPLDR